MINSLNKNRILLLALVSISIISCKKKEETPVTSEPNPSTTTNCFNALYNGTYVGSGYLMSGAFTSGTLTIVKTNCQVVNLNLSVNTGGGLSTQASQLQVNSSNNSYDGKLSNGNNINISPGGNNVFVNAVGSFTFNGNK